MIYYLQKKMFTKTAVEVNDGKTEHDFRKNTAFICYTNTWNSVTHC